MAKLAKKRLAAKSAAKARKQSSSQSRSKKAAPDVVRAGTKQATAIEMLRSPGGTTIEALMKVTRWEQHSVRGFLAGVVRKRLKLDLDSSVVDGQRVYRVTGSGLKKAAEGQTRQNKS
jgi:pyrroline-5-carboxylate reductase